MKIENSVKTVPASPVNEASISAAKPGLKAAEVAAGREKQGDSVQLSTQLQGIAKNLASGEVFDAERVAKIKQSISDRHFDGSTRLSRTIRSAILRSCQSAVPLMS